jgi:thiosulfate dehydrogenase
MKKTDDKDLLLNIISRQNRLILILSIALILVPLLLVNRESIAESLSELFVSKEIKHFEKPESNENSISYWKGYNTAYIEDSIYKAQIMYGKELIVHTSKYLGPNGSVMKLTNGLNCQNCHLEAGTKTFGNNYGSVASLYPKVRARSGTEVDIPGRINGCFERSMNGKALDRDSKELQAMTAYMEYIGSNVPKGVKAEGSGLKDVRYLDRPANPDNGKIIYENKCASCHMPNGEGALALDETEYLYPPLWGEHSFNDGAGLSRITKMARYVKYNMPFGVQHDAPELSDEETWDVSAYILSQQRPHLETPNDWPDLTKKPIDHPFGPYADQFTEEQHKYGPFQPILNARKQ